MAAAIRNMTPADLPAIETIEQRVFTEPWDMGSYAACLRSGCYARVAEDAGTVAGYAVLHQLRHERSCGVRPRSSRSRLPRNFRGRESGPRFSLIS